VAALVTLAIAPGRQPSGGPSRCPRQARDGPPAGRRRRRPGDRPHLGRGMGRWPRGPCPRRSRRRADSRVLRPTHDGADRLHLGRRERRDGGRLRGGRERRGGAALRRPELARPGSRGAPAAARRGGDRPGRSAHRLAGGGGREHSCPEVLRQIGLARPGPPSPTRRRRRPARSRFPLTDTSARSADRLRSQAPSGDRSCAADGQPWPGSASPP